MLKTGRQLPRHDFTPGAQRAAAHAGVEASASLQQRVTKPHNKTTPNETQRNLGLARPVSDTFIKKTEQATGPSRPNHSPCAMDEKRNTRQATTCCTITRSGSLAHLHALTRKTIVRRQGAPRNSPHLGSASDDRVSSTVKQKKINKKQRTRAAQPQISHA